MGKHIKSKPSKKTIVILGGGIRKDANGKWGSAGFNDRNKFGAMGAKLRVAAAYVLHSKDPKQIIIASGKRGIYKNIAGMPTVAEVIAGELTDLGIPESAIVKEEKSDTTWQQLRELKKIIKKENLGSASVVSNRYHLPRIQAMVEADDELRALLHKRRIELVSAEEVLIKHDPKQWQEKVDKAYHSKEMKKRITIEEKGVRNIKSGTYKFR